MFLVAELFYNSVCHNVTMYVRRPFTLEFYNLNQSEPIFTEIGKWPPFMILNKNDIMTYDLRGQGGQQCKNNLNLSSKNLECETCWWF